MSEHILDSRFQRARGVIGRYPREGERYILEYLDVAERDIHMIGVRRPLRVTWLVGDDVVQEAVLSPWTGSGSARADTVIEERPEEVTASSDSRGT